MKHPEGCICCALGPEAAAIFEQDTIREYGHMVRGVMDDPQGLAYSVGLWDQGLPELVITGLNMRSATVLINMAAAKMKDVGIPRLGSIENDLYNLPARYAGVALDAIVERMPDALGQIKRTGGALPAMPAEYSSPAIQIIWSDREGRFPEHPGFSKEFAGRQSILA